MSTGQMYSGKGETTTQIPQNVQTAANSTVQSEETLISSSIDRTKSQVEAAISYLVKDYEGSDIPKSAFHDLTAEINRIISQNFAGGASVIPDACRPVYIRVPEYIAERLTDPDRLREEVRYAAEAMRDFARDRPAEGEEQQAHYDGVYDSILWILDMATNTLEGRAAGIPLDQAIKAEESKPTNTRSNGGNDPKSQELKGVLRVNLPLSTTHNSNTALSEVELVQMALRKLQYDHTRKMVNMVAEDCLEQAARVANELTVADAVMGKLFHTMSSAVDGMNNAIMGLGDRAKDVVYAGFEDNINRVFREHYIEYRDDAARPGV